jgi:hypothetical protein
MGTAAFEVAKMMLKVPKGKKFPMVSDEFNGVNTGEDGKPRPNKIRNISVDKAIQENQDSRVYLGVHWDFDSSEGGRLGKAVAANVVAAFPNRA